MPRSTVVRPRYCSPRASSILPGPSLVTPQAQRLLLIVPLKMNPRRPRDGDRQVAAQFDRRTDHVGIRGRHGSTRAITAP